MELIALFTLGILSGQLASLVYSGYTLGALGNGIAGLTGAIFLSKYLTIIFGMSAYTSMFVGGVLGAFFILVLFSAGESLVTKR
jgi:uncharacterized membrane protein YeaQ/YmgE (transglycosylase-associated protein family)